MSKEMIAVPVEATMRRQSDGSFQIVEAVYINISPDVIAQWLAEQFHVSVKHRDEVAAR